MDVRRFITIDGNNAKLGALGQRLHRRRSSNKSKTPLLMAAAIIGSNEPFGIEVRIPSQMNEIPAL